MGVVILQGAAAAAAVGRPRASPRSRSWCSPSTTAGRLDRAGAGVHLRHLRPDQEDRPTSARWRAWPSRPGGRALASATSAGWSPRRRGRSEPRHGARIAAASHRHGHRRPADLLRGRRHPGPAGHRGPAPVPRARAPVRARRVRLRRADAGVPLGRLRAGLVRAGDLHGRVDQPPPSPAAGSRQPGNVRRVSADPAPARGVRSGSRTRECL